MQVLLLARPVQERRLLLEEGLPRREEHRAADVQPDPLPVAPPGRVDDRAVADALRRRPARFRRGGRGGGRALPRLVVFVVVVIIVVVIAVAVSVAAVARRRSSDVRRFELLVRRCCHLETGVRHEVKTSEGRPSVSAVASALSLPYQPTKRPAD